MISVRLNQSKFIKDMNNIVQYSYGFLDGVQKGKRLFLNNIGLMTKEILESFIDSTARSNPQMLHHVYEWYKVGSPEARLFDIRHTVSNVGVSFYSSFRQSSSVKEGSSEPFYNKAKIMEDGSPVVIRPTRASVLVFDDNGDTVFTKGPVRVSNPGGLQVEGGFQRVFDLFFNRYFSQAFLRTSGIMQYFNNPVLYKQNISKGKVYGKSAGMSTGYKWVANAGVKI